MIKGFAMTDDVLKEIKGINTWEYGHRCLMPEKQPYINSSANTLEKKRFARLFCKDVGYIFGFLAIYSN